MFEKKLSVDGDAFWYGLNFKRLLSIFVVCTLLGLVLMKLRFPTWLGTGVLGFGFAVLLSIFRVRRLSDQEANQGEPFDRSGGTTRDRGK